MVTDLGVDEMVKNSKGALCSFRARIRHLETGRILQGHYLVIVDRTTGTVRHPEPLRLLGFKNALLHTFKCLHCHEKAKYRLVAGTFKDFKYLDKKITVVKV